MLSPTECRQHLSKAAVPIPGAMEAIAGPRASSDRAQSQPRLPHPSRDTASGSTSAQPSCTALENNNKLICKGCRPLLLYSLNIWNILHMFMKGMPGPFVSNPQQIHFPFQQQHLSHAVAAGLYLLSLRVTHHDRTKLKFTSKLFEFLPPFNSQQLQPTSPLITTRFSSSCLEP